MTKTPGSTTPRSTTPGPKRPRGLSKPPRPKFEPAAPKDAERIAKVMARAGAASRREAETLIEQGRVSVNGKVIDSPALNVSARDRILVDGQPLPQRERTRLFLFHKPRGLVTTRIDPQGRPTIDSVLPADLPRLVSVGRLDLNTEGLLLLTNDGGLKRVLELPATGWLRRYRVRAFGQVMQPQLDALRKGIEVDGVRYGPIEATLEREQGDNVWLTFAMREGKNREIRNVMRSLGLQVNRLIRVSYGPFQLGDMAEGAVEEVRTKMLREQLGERLAAAAGADFAAPMAERAPAETRTRERPRHDARSGDAPSRDGRSRDGKSRESKPRDGKARDSQTRDGKSRESRPRDAKFGGAKSRDGKSREDRSRDDKPRDGRPRDGRPQMPNARRGQAERTRPGHVGAEAPESRRGRAQPGRPPRAGASADRNATERPQRSRPQGGKPHGHHEGFEQSGGKPHSGRSHGGKPHDARPRGAKPRGAKPHGAKPHGATPYGAKPHGAKSRAFKSSDAKFHGGKSRSSESHSFNPQAERPQQDKPAAPLHRRHRPSRGKHTGPRPSRPKAP